MSPAGTEHKCLKILVYEGRKSKLCDSVPPFLISRGKILPKTTPRPSISSTSTITLGDVCGVAGLIRLNVTTTGFPRRPT
jgi:hypothetical protein